MRAAINTEIITRRVGRNTVNLNKMFSLRSFQIKILENRSLQLQKELIEKRKKILNNILEESSNRQNGMSNIIGQLLNRLGIGKFAKNLNRAAKIKTKRMIPRKIRSTLKKPTKIAKDLKRTAVVKGKKMIPRQLRPKPSILKVKPTSSFKSLSKIAPNIGKKIPVLNVLFTGLDVAGRLSQGQTKTQAVAGAGAGLAGSLAGGAIGQALIPIPVVGFAVGSMLGGFLASKLSDKVTGVDQPQIVDKKTSKIRKGTTKRNRRGRIIKEDDSIKNDFIENNIANITSSDKRNEEFVKSNIAKVKLNKSGQTLIVQNQPDTIVKSVPSISNSNGGGGSIIVSKSSYDAALTIAKLEAARTV